MVVLKNNILANFLFTVLMETETLCRRVVSQLMSIMSGVMPLLPKALCKILYDSVRKQRDVGGVVRH